MPDIFDYLKSPTCWVIFLGCFVVTTFLTPWVMAFAEWLGGIEGGGYRKIHQSPTPLLGGLAVSIPFVAVALGSRSQKTSMFHVVGEHSWDFIVLSVGCIAITVLGVVDDVRGMRARHKLFGQILVAVLVACSGYAIKAINVPLIGVISLDHTMGMGFLLTVLWIVGITNAVNIIDGMDGLAAGVSLIAAASLAVLAGFHGTPFVVLLCVALSGSLLAFLRFNWHPARIFLGDTGSMFLGFALATLSLMGSYKSHGTVLMLAAVMALGIPIFETLISIIRRYAGGFPIFTGDARHTHHRLMRMGMSQRQVAWVLYAGGLLCLAAAVLEVVLPKESPQSLIPTAIFLVTLMSIAAAAGYTTSIAAKFQRRKETMRQLAFARYAAMTLVPGASHQTVSRVMGLICEEFGLGFVAMEFDGGRGRIASVDPADSLHIVAPHSALDRFFVKASDGSHVEVAFQHSHGVSSIERHITTACLVRIFEGISRGFLDDVAPKVQDEELLPGVSVLLPHKSESSPAGQPGTLKAVPPPPVPVEAMTDGTRVENTN